MDLQCPSCNHKVSSRDLPQIDGGVITCQGCGEEYHIQRHVIDPEDRFHKQIWDQPKELIVSRQAGEVVIRLKKHRSKWGIIISVLLVEGIMAILLQEMWSSLNHHPITYVILTVLVISPILLLVSVFRHQIITFRQGMIRVEYGIPRIFARSKAFLPTDFEQFFVQEHVIRKSDRRISVSYSVNGKRKGEEETVCILRRIQTSAVAYYIEQELEAFFSLQDVPYTGEYDSRRKLRLSVREKMSLAKQIFRISQTEYKAKSKEERQAEIKNTPIQNYIAGLLIFGGVSAVMLYIAMDEGGFFPWLFGGGFGLMTVLIFITLIKRMIWAMKE
ncbi:MAG: hypothetical protein AAF206_23445 [Bacteroidota bacterium]